MSDPRPIRIRKSFADGPPRAYERAYPHELDLPHKAKRRIHSAIKRAGLVLARDEQNRLAMFTMREWHGLRPQRRRMS